MKDKVIVRSRGCYTCKYVLSHADSERCLPCKYSGNLVDDKDNWEPRNDLTNMDRIKLMSDEELAEFLSKHYVCKPEGSCPVKECPGSECKEQIKRWLQEGVLNENEM